MADDRETRSQREGSEKAGNIFEGISKILESLGDLAEKGEELRRSGEVEGSEGKARGVYGFRIRTAGGDSPFKVEPFGNVQRDESTGEPTVSDAREPIVDVFDEASGPRVVAELPGIEESDVRLDVRDRALRVTAERGEKKYHKEVELPRAVAADDMVYTCRNGVLEVRFGHAHGEE